MVNANSLVAGLALALTATAVPVEQTAKTLTAAQLIQIAPSTASCSPSNAFPAECAPASRAAPAIANSFAKYGINTPGAQSALIGLMLFETGNFVYSTHHFPSVVPGQGTRNMQSAQFNIAYAQSLSPQKAAGATAANVLNLLSDDDASFGSAAWFLTNKCDKSILTGLADGSSAGWDAYLTKCVGTSHDPARDVAWTAAKKVLGA